MEKDTGWGVLRLPISWEMGQGKTADEEQDDKSLERRCHRISFSFPLSD